ncbi:ABC-2 type transport system permease protein [Flavobacterium succinicans]|jgi:ABC-2 type transport system permease protein|uniref:ABC-2 type transport system permease protein n=1 Tax=Flavobacterium succinicans TaxID=29536 RepID=A0A1I4XC48_9FLAO|nr:ABC transporter permease [Flavobacterium succinicans]SFN23484.1 ABC-2 type transport system permease protein [Flavobacterium succinicans]
MMWQLIKIEWYKLFKQKRTYWALGAIVIIEAMVLVGAYFQGTDIIELLLENLRKSFYFKGNLLNGNLMVYLLLNTLWFHLPLILMILVSGMITTEYKDKTLQAIFLQPVSKLKFITAKYLVAIQLTIVVLLFLAFTSIVFSNAIFGHGDLIVYLESLNFFTDAIAKQRILLAFVSGGFSMLFYTVVSMTLALVIKEATATWIASSFFLVFTNLLLKIDLSSTFLNQWFYVKLIDSWQYFFYPEIAWNQVYFNTILLFIYTLITAVLGGYLFIRKDLD